MRAKKQLSPPKKIHPCLGVKNFQNFKKKKSSSVKVTGKKKKSVPVRGQKKKIHPFPNFLPPQMVRLLACRCVLPCCIKHQINDLFILASIHLP